MNDSFIQCQPRPLKVPLPAGLLVVSRREAQSQEAASSRLKTGRHNAAGWGLRRADAAEIACGVHHAAPGSVRLLRNRPE